MQGWPVFIERLCVLWALSRWILQQPVTAEPGPGSRACSQASALGCLLPCLLHPQGAQGYVGPGRAVRLRVSFLPSHAGLAISGKAATAGSDMRQRMEAGGLGSGQKC